jgi:hypothetical protein
MRVESSGFTLPEGEQARMQPTGDGRFTAPLYGDTYEYFAGKPLDLSGQGHGQPVESAATWMVGRTTR